MPYHLYGVDNTRDVSIDRISAGMAGITEGTDARSLRDLKLRDLVATGKVTSVGSLGYAAGAGGTITQQTNRSTGVTINTLCGAITTTATSLAAGAEATFTVTNSTVAIGDCVIVTARSGQTAATSIPFVTAVADGSFKITLSNFNASTADTGAMVINFAIIKAVSA